MKNVIAWIKSNPITVLSALLIIVSVAFMGWIKLVKAPEMLATATQPDRRTSNGSIRCSVKSFEVPPANADDPPEQISGITVNEPVVQVMDQIFGGLNHEADEIRKTALGINQAGHDLLVEGLFPDTPADQRFHREDQLRQGAADVDGHGRAGRDAGGRHRHVDALPQRRPSRSIRRRSGSSWGNSTAKRCSRATRQR